MAQTQQQQNLPFVLDALYCEEEHCESLGEDIFGEEEGSYSSDNIISPNPPQLLEQDLLWEDEELASLLSKEEENHLLHRDLESNPSLDGARRDAVEWILMVNAHFSFSPLTAVLAVNYFDRFLLSFHVQGDRPWMGQLAAVSCLSLAAKVEETEVPHILDLQVEETRYVFEVKTIQRMEILILSTLQWKMHPVTPLSFLDYIARRMGLKNHLCWEFLHRCQCLVLSVISDSRFMCYLPSALATAVALHVIDSLEPCVAVDYKNQLLGSLGIRKDKVEDCYKLIVESTSRLSHKSNKRKLRSMPSSPKGVMDVSFSSDGSSDSPSMASSVSSSPEPLSKKSRARAQEDYDHHLQSLNHAAAGILSFPP